MTKHYSVQDMEVVHDISMAAGYKLTKGEIDVMDSRELFSRILEWAEEFMRFHEKSSWDSEDYIGAVDEFALMKLAEVYGSEEEAECDWCGERHVEKKCIACRFTACFRCFSGETCPNCKSNYVKEITPAE
ncbi:hypothetical protein [Paenibacillus tyrfis]|uniref:hypothetical protein n=1 Tax=Paenibacillus tyrfis TaxID=1501230 RepID=UPI0020A0D9F5|nr:hypothetical protein [Paenibacillus tyrfis]MCP1312118.1 hypothetical protein [Paenibacillus tyrfis]